jgi:preprotein translocase subunit SecG
MNSIYNWVVLISAVIVTLLILVQTRGASLGAGFGGGGEINIVRRGSDKTLHQITIITVFIFVGSIIASIVA